MAQPPMLITMTYMQKFSAKRRVAIGFICSFAISKFCGFGSNKKSYGKGISEGQKVVKKKALNTGLGYKCCV